MADRELLKQVIDDLLAGQVEHFLFENARVAAIADTRAGQPKASRQGRLRCQLCWLAQMDSRANVKPQPGCG